MCLYVSVSVSVCVRIYGYVHMSTSALRGQRHQIPLAKVTSHCMCPVWMFGIRLGYSARAMWALIAKLSLALIYFFLFSSMLLVKHSALNMLSISGTNESKQSPASGCSWQRVEMFSNIQPRLSSFRNSILWCLMPLLRCVSCFDLLCALITLCPAPAASAADRWWYGLTVGMEIQVEEGNKVIFWLSKKRRFLYQGVCKLVKLKVYLDIGKWRKRNQVYEA